jgi:ribosomal protein S27AE
MRAVARAYANVYQRRGKLVPQPCERCQAAGVQKHHDDYTRPLEVRWFCRKCHLDLHLGGKTLHVEPKP